MKSKLKKSIVYLPFVVEWQVDDEEIVMRLPNQTVDEVIVKGLDKYNAENKLVIKMRDDIGVLDDA